MRAIVAVDKKWGIGKNNDLLFSIPDDMKFFRATTLNKVVVMGANTLKSFPNGNPLKNRVNIVLSNSIEDRDDCIVCRTLDSLLSEISKYDSGDVFIIGGGRFYNAMLPYCSGALVTKVDADGEAEVFFPNLDELPNWSLLSESETVSSNGFNIKFTEYVNSQVK